MVMKFIYVLFLFNFFIFKSLNAQLTELVLNDPDKNAPTNIRAKPGGPVIGTIDSREESLSVHIVRKEGSYYLVDYYELCGRSRKYLPKSGYIHNSLLGGYIQFDKERSIPVYQGHVKSSPIKRVNYLDGFVSIQDYKNDMMYIYYRPTNEKFWIEDKYICLNPCTTCY